MDTQFKIIFIISLFIGFFIEIGAYFLYKLSGNKRRGGIFGIVSIIFGIIFAFVDDKDLR